MYKFQAVILNITKIRDNNTRIVMMSEEYWKITGWWNKKNISGIDLGDIIEVLLSREWSKNTIKNIDIKTSGWSKNWNYSRIYSFMETLHILNKVSIDGMDCRKLYEDITFFIKYGINKEMTLFHYVAFQMRILKSLGSMDPNMFSWDPILEYIYNNISHTPLERIFGSKNIKIDHIEKIQKINLHSIYMLHQ